MTVRNILRVKKDGHKFYVLAEPFWAKYKIKHLNSQTKEFMSSNNVNYRLFKLQDGKIIQTLGFISSLEPGAQFVNILDANHSNDDVPFLEYHPEEIFIIEKIYTF